MDENDAIDWDSSDSSEDEDYIPPEGGELDDEHSEDDNNLAVVGRNRRRPAPISDEEGGPGGNERLDLEDSASLPSVGTGRNDSDVEEMLQDSSGLNVNGNDDGSDSESLPSVGAPGEESEEQQPAQVSNGPVAGFRVRVDSDGEEHFEFASDTDEFQDETSDEDPPPLLNEVFGVAPAVDFALPMSIVASVAQRAVQRNRLAAQQNRRRRLEIASSANQLPVQPTSNNQVAELPPLNIPQPGPSTSSATTGRQFNIRPARRKAVKRKRQKKKPKKKASPKKPKAPPKPLGPLTIYEDWNGNEDYKDFLKKISKTTQHRIHINFQDGPALQVKNSSITATTSQPQSVDGSQDKQNEEANSDFNAENDEAHSFLTPPKTGRRNSLSQSNITELAGYKLGHVAFDRCGRVPWTSLNKLELLKTYPNISELTLHVSQHPSSSILHLKTKRTLTKEESTAHKINKKLSKRDSERELILVVTQHFFFHVDPVAVPIDLFSTRALGNRKTFAIDFNHFDMDKQCFIFDVVLLDSAIVGDHDVHEIPLLRFQQIQDVFTNFLGVSPPPAALELEARQKEDIAWFYGQIRKFHARENLPFPEISLQPSSLKPTLRKYQRDAVHWMLYREGYFDNFADHPPSEFLNGVTLTEAFLDKMFIPIQLTKHVVSHKASDSPPVILSAYYNPFTAYVCWEKPKVPALPSGGILCDEMGLGKTVETLALILINKKQIPEELEDYFNGTIKEEVNEQEEDDDSSSWEDLPSSSSSSSDSSDDDNRTNSRKRKKRGGRSSQKKKVKKTRRVVQSEQPKVPSRNLRRRAASPCEFTVASEEDEPGSSQPPSRLTSPSKLIASTSTSITVAEAFEQQIKLIGKPGGKRKKSNDSETPGKPRAPKLYDAMKVLYDAALCEYRFADQAKCTPKFHGRFYETDIDSRECFECVCGGLKESCRADDIVKCCQCSSSQHAQCVGFDHTLKVLFQKLGRSYLCPHCEALEPPFETKSTLIITPQSISHQWIKEIQKHVQNHRLNILFYKGVSTHGYIPPAQLARYDIVITTYSVLSTELDYVDLPHCSSADGRRFRNPKRFLTIPSPLPSVLWWRVCLDEAQMVEGIGTKMSMMAMRIKAVHRWCVTGTPVNKGLQDLFGLFVFLKIYPISYDIWWDALVRDAFYRKETSLLYELFGQLIWRNGKEDVLDQLGIPPQKDVTHWLNFSPVETHFYKQQFEICSNRILEKINRLKRLNPDVDILKVRLSSLDRFSLHGLLAPFLELRQACCHPQIVKGQLISLQKGTLTMEELLERLVKKTQMQCHEDHRLIVAALNGMAGLYIIQSNFKESADKYRQVLQSAEKQKEHFQTDSLQLLHTIENLAEILDGNHDGIPFTLRDESLRANASELREKYMKKYADAVKSTQDTVTPLSNAVVELKDQFTMHTQSWWAAVLKKATRIQKIDTLVHSLKQDLMDVTKKNIKTSGSISNKFDDAYGLERLLVQKILEMEQLRDTVLEGLEELQTNDPQEFVETAIRCHLRQKSSNYYNDSGEEETKCKLCSYHINFLFYESVIFKVDNKDKINRTGRNYQQRKLMGELADELEEKTRTELLQQEAEDLKATTEHVQLINEELRRGTWGDSETEVILKGIHRFARVNKLSKEINENGTVHIKLLDAVKKEFKFLRILWRKLFDQVSALDELSQATTRLMAVSGDIQQYEQPSTSRNVKQLRSGILEKTLKIQNIHLIGYHEVETRMQQMLNDHATGQESLSLHLGQLLYLKTLKRNGYGKKGTLNTEDCPICSVQLGKEWSVLRCGHSYCSECVKKMCPNALHPFLCPLCRHSMKFADVSFVDTTENEQEATANGSNQLEQPQKAREVKGSHSTKVEAIVETLLQLQESHPGEKCIIFSTWNDVLEIVAAALNQNDIKYSYVNQSGRPFHANLEKFKEREDLQVLLMPLTSGAKGLNIIEATHVLLVEPILNLASELQAIGRVHRIGQTKQTFVHRFYVRRTIEEKLFQILKEQDISSDEEGSLTVKELQQLISAVTK
ncbi:E3 ubiquitin-protein ligase SHPRH [Orchesella cincta]|uniref:E3 ubiquitin-protein ligase SHPRH n=1 Tax=Orchesella cincta TaxID=48709 RepID=A0A1D2NEW6_ORCCI|nr:E3 ubiquitin-protein ligase SHPRH [Orchesella cincta]